MHRNFLQDLDGSQISSNIQEILEQIETIDNKHGLVTSLNHLGDLFNTRKGGFEETSTFSILSRLLHKVFSVRLSQLSVVKDTQVKSKLFDLLNNTQISRLILYQVLLQTLSSITDSPITEVRLEYDRKNLFEDLLSDTLLSQDYMTKFVQEIFEVSSSSDFSELLKTVSSFPARVSNYLENCPHPLKPENFFLAFVEIGLEQNEDFKKKREDYYLQLVNTLVINGQTNTFVKYWVEQIRNLYKDKPEESTWKNDFLFNLLSKNPDRIVNYAKVIREVLLIFSKAINEAIPLDVKTLILVDLLKNVEPKYFISIYLSRFLNEKAFNRITSMVLADVILAYPGLSKAKDTNQQAENKINGQKAEKIKADQVDDFFTQVVESGLAVWSEAGFIQNASIQHLKFLTNFLRRIISQVDKGSLHKPEVIELIQQGIGSRLQENLSGTIQKQCAEAVWTAYIRQLGITEAVALIEKEGLYDKEVTDGNEDQEEKATEEAKEKQQTKPPKKVEVKEESKKKKDDSDDDDEFYQLEEQVEEENILTLTKPKHIYDCLLGLRTENRERVEYSLKYVNYLIRKKLSDVELIAEELALTLCKINNQFDWEEFDQYRSRALISLVIVIPESISQCLIKRFYYSETSLGEKLLMLDILEKSAKELSDNPEKYNPELYNEYHEEQNFYFKPTSVKYYSAEEKKQEEINKQKQEKVEQQSRRWGETRRKKEQEGGNLVTMDAKEILIINSDSEKIFINRFNSLCNNFFFPLVTPLREKKRILLKEHLMLSKIISLMKTYLQCSKNSLAFYSILQEVLDFLIAFVTVDDNNVLQEVLTCFYLISTIMNKNVVVYYDLIVQKLLLLMKLITDLGQKVDKFKIFVYEISTNIQKLFEVGLPTNINIS